VDLRDALLSSSRASVVAPAGCGKTHLIADAIASLGDGRQLILTHTHAGVDALRRRLVKLGAARPRYALDTIAGWALALVNAFPKRAGLDPTIEPVWSDVYEAATRLSRSDPIAEILRCSYDGIVVDEYQDCTLGQHGLVLALAEVLPCRVLGDPLQGIFDFKEPIVTWKTDVVGTFAEVGRLSEPWRWKDGDVGLGRWLLDVREELEAGRSIDLRTGPARWIDGSDHRFRTNRQVDACFAAARVRTETVVAIAGWPNQAQKIAGRLKGAFSRVEPIEAPDLQAFAADFDAAQGQQRSLLTLDFACSCIAGLKSALTTIRKGLVAGKAPRVKNHRDQLAALTKVGDSDRAADLHAALESMLAVPDTSLYRRELFHEACRAARAVAGGEHQTLREAALAARHRTSRIGRRLPRYAVGTTLLVKGLEFDHAVVLNPEKYNARNLYVALTRASKSLVVISDSPVLTPMA
jgi:DNA helicase-2/ATP-dependent DNA helicase PcrA